MKLSTLKKDIWYLIVYLIAAVGCAVVTSSCTSVKKLRSVQHQETVKTETVQKTDTKDSTSKTITKTIDLSGTSITIEYDSTTADTATTFDIITYPATKDQYFEKVSIKSNIKPKSITFSAKKLLSKEKFDSTVRKNRIVENARKDEKISINKKTVNLEKKRFNWWPVFAVMALAVIIGIYYYRKPIRTFIIKLISPFKFLS